VGTEEDGVDEAGRAADPTVIVAPPGLDIDPEVKAADEVVDNGTMPSSRDDAVTGNGNGEAPRRGEIATDVPFPADGIGKPKSATRDATAESADADGHSDNGHSDDDHSADGRSGGATTAASSVLDTGRQAVRHAMAATNSLFSTRSGKSDSDDSGEDATPAPSRPAMTQSSIMAPPVSTASPAASVFTPAERRPSFTPSSSRDTADPATSSAAPSSSSAPASSSPASSYSSSAASSLTPPSTAPSSPSGSSRTGQAGSGGQSLWREVRRPSPASSSSAPPIPGTAPGGPSDPSRPAGPGGSPPPGSSYSGQHYAPPSSGSRPGSPAPGAHAGSPSGQGLSAAAAAVGGAAAGLASSVTSAFQGRNAGTKQRKRRPAGVRRSPKRQAQLTLARVEPWSVMKFSFVVSVVAFIILFVAVAVLYMVLSALGVFTSLQHTVNSITSSQGQAGTNISTWFSASRILGYTGMLGALNIVLITAMSTIGAVIYNLIATTIGGVEVTLRETE
jgi:Transmembrane domain of unknown function (DUF3566)